MYIYSFPGIFFAFTDFFFVFPEVFVINFFILYKASKFSWNFSTIFFKNFFFVETSNQTWKIFTKFPHKKVFLYFYITSIITEKSSNHITGESNWRQKILWKFYTKEENSLFGFKFSFFELSSMKNELKIIREKLENDENFK